MPAVGGVARRATKINETRNREPFVLLLDAGDSLTGDQDPARATQGKSSIELMNRLGYDAAALGSQDLALGVETLRQRQSEAQFALLSANAADARTGELIAQPYVVRILGGQRIAIIGLSDDAQIDGVTVRDPFDAVRQALDELAGRAGIVILLSHAGLEVDQVIAAEIPAIDIIVSGGIGVAAEPARHPDSGVLQLHADSPQPGHAGRVLGFQTLDFDASGQLRQETLQYITLGPEIPDDQEIAAWINAKPAQ